ncbi:unnamed protein product, partial [Ixodes pacificus]
SGDARRLSERRETATPHRHRACPPVPVGWFRFVCFSKSSVSQSRLLLVVNGQVLFFFFLNLFLLEVLCAVSRETPFHSCELCLWCVYLFRTGLRIHSFPQQQD